MKMQSLLHIHQPRLGAEPWVLVVEDNEDSLILVTQVLELLHCNVIGVKEGRSSLALAEIYQPELILLDIVLPDIDGLELASQLRQLPATSSTPIIAVTALAKPDDRQQMLYSGCTDYIAKPYILEDLETMIRLHLQQTPAVAAAKARSYQ